MSGINEQFSIEIGKWYYIDSGDFVDKFLGKNPLVKVQVISKRDDLAAAVVKPINKKEIFLEYEDFISECKKPSFFERISLI